MTYLILAQVGTSHENNFHGSGAWFHLDLPVMATAEDFRKLFEQIVHAAATGATACAREPDTRNLDGRRFRELGGFGGNEEEWKELALKFRATLKEINPKLHLLVKWARWNPTRSPEVGSGRARSGPRWCTTG